jgi:hypothetical protein
MNMGANFQIVEAKPWHAGQMTRLLRAEHRDAVVAIGVSAHRELRARFDESYFRRAWLRDGELIGLGGVTGSALSYDGMVWLALAVSAARNPIAMVREARRQIDELMTLKRSLMTVILPSDAASFRFARHLGFVARPDVPTIFEAVAMEYREPLSALAAFKNNRRLPSLSLPR